MVLRDYIILDLVGYVGNLNFILSGMKKPLEASEQVRNIMRFRFRGAHPGH